MSYYVIKTYFNKDGVQTQPEITKYKDYDTALRSFYEILTLVGKGGTKIGALLLDENLNEIKKDVYVKVVEPEPEEPTDEESNE